MRVDGGGGGRINEEMRSFPFPRRQVLKEKEKTSYVDLILANRSALQ